MRNKNNHIKMEMEASFQTQEPMMKILQATLLKCNLKKEI